MFLLLGHRTEGLCHRSPGTLKQVPGAKSRPSPTLTPSSGSSATLVWTHSADARLTWERRPPQLAQLLRLPLGQAQACGEVSEATSQRTSPLQVLVLPGFSRRENPLEGLRAVLFTRPGVFSWVPSAPGLSLTHNEAGAQRRGPRCRNMCAQLGGPGAAPSLQAFSIKYTFSCLRVPPPD